MTATLQVQRNTRVQLPDISAAGLAHIAQTMIGQEPAQAGRIERGLVVLQTAEILETREMGVYLVESCDRGAYHLATTFSCSCKDAQHRGPGCKHSRALQILHAATAEARMDTWRKNWVARKAEQRAQVAVRQGVGA